MRNLVEYARNSKVPNRRQLTNEEYEQLFSMMDGTFEGTLKALSTAYSADYESGQRSCHKT